MKNKVACTECHISRIYKHVGDVIAKEPTSMVINIWVKFQMDAYVEQLGASRKVVVLRGLESYS